jgi:hypothetical protein
MSMRAMTLRGALFRRRVNVWPPRRLLAPRTASSDHQAPHCEHSRAVGRVHRPSRGRGNGSCEYSRPPASDQRPPRCQQTAAASLHDRIHHDRKGGTPDLHARASRRPAAPHSQIGFPDPAAERASATRSTRRSLGRCSSNAHQMLSWTLCTRRLCDAAARNRRTTRSHAPRGYSGRQLTAPAMFHVERPEPDTHLAHGCNPDRAPVASCSARLAGLRPVARPAPPVPSARRTEPLWETRNATVSP